MTDIAHILALPVPLRTPPTAVARNRGEAGVSVDSRLANSALADSAAENGDRARRFRFQVYENGVAGKTGTETDSRRAGGSGRSTAVQNRVGGAENSANAVSGRPAGSRNPAFQGGNAGTSSAFLAQAIAQEQLGPGLHNPPFAQAAAAYAQAARALAAPAGARVSLSV